jgi:uncharacterized protein YciI
MHYLMIYDLAADYLERRGEYRDEHLRMAWESHERGEMVLAGAMSESFDMAVLLFQGDSPAAAQRFAQADPYVIHGLVTGYKIKLWNTVVGDLATAPARPA